MMPLLVFGGVAYLTKEENRVDKTECATKPTLKMQY